MGLAASQARFLAITARKANCEFRSMQIAQDKLSVTRDLARISSDYQEAMNKTTLVWDYDGTGSVTTNLSYNLLMTPSEMNGFNPYFVTERTGAIVLSSKYAAAAKAAGIDKRGGDRTLEGFERFMEELGNNGLIGKSTADSIIEFIDDDSYNKDIGYGATPLNKNELYAQNTTGLAYKLQEMEKNNNNRKLGDILENYYHDYDHSKTGEPIDQITQTLAERITSSTNINGRDYGGKYRVSKNGTYQNSGQVLGNLTLSDLLTEDIVFTYTAYRQQHYPKNADGSNNSYYNGETDRDKTKAFVEMTDGILKAFHDEITRILGVDTESILALQKAYETIEYNYSFSKCRIDSGKATATTFSQVVSDADRYNALCYGNIPSDDSRETIAVNLSNMISAYLTYFELYLNGYNSPYSVGASSTESNFVTDDPNYNYVMRDGNKLGVDVKMADFYMQLYNNICIYGWSENERVENDNKYLEQMLKNGNFFISSLSYDGYYYQDRYNEGDYILEIKDKDAIAQAEAEFQAQKAKLTYKEEKLDLDMKNLDVEISSLTTEYDSVKQLISKSVEKVFSQFQ